MEAHGPLLCNLLILIVLLLLILLLLMKGCLELLWKYVKVIQKNSTTGGNARSECLFCGHVIPGSYFRVRAHLLKESNKGTSICSAVNDELLEELRKEDAAAKAAEASSQNRSVPMPIQIPFADSSSALPPQGARSAKRKKQLTIADGFHLELRRMADAIIARLFYTGGSPLFFSFRHFCGSTL